MVPCREPTHTAVHTAFGGASVQLAGQPEVLAGGAGRLEFMQTAANRKEA